MARDVTDQTFEREVLAASEEHPVVVDLWAPWCGPCRTLGPIIEQAVAERGGEVLLAKVNVDENPQISASFQVQSIPAVYAIKDRKVIDGFIGALPASEVRAFLERIAPSRTEIDDLVDLGDETSLRQALELKPDHEQAVLALAELLVTKNEPREALSLLARIPESPETRRIAALARLAEAGEADLAGSAELERRLDALLERVKGDDQARQEFLDLLETLPTDDARRTSYRRALSARLF